MNADYCQVCGCDICCCVFEDGLVVITPEEAKKLLKGSSDNRPLDETLVNRFAEDMLKGKWKHPEVAINRCPIHGEDICTCNAEHD